MKRTLHWILLLLLCLSLGAWLVPATAAPPPGGSQGVQGPFMSEPVVPAVFNGDLRDLPQLGPEVPGLEALRPGIPPKSLPESAPGGVDPVAQRWQGEGQMPEPIMNFLGMSRNDGGGWYPPDTVGDVGPSHYVQAVNVGFGVFDKATGTPLVKMLFNTLFDGTGTPCDNQNRGDVIALYDHLADRWLLTDFSLPSTGPVYQCLAISQTGDPVAGGWYFYAYVTEPDGQPWHDYPKLSVWPDAYYMTANMFDPWSGAWVWAFDREAMLNGDPLTAVRFEAGEAYGSLLPGNLEGPLPPPGAPAYFASIDIPNLLRLWEFHVDWDVPGNSTFTGPVNLEVAPYDYTWDIPQPSPGGFLDSLGDRLMMQLQYRNFGDVESLWVNHSVLSGGVMGVRWYEVRDPGGAPILYQQGTYQPDDHYRWMGSLAVDGEGNMAVGYSVSSSTLRPSIRYAGRRAGEVPGVLPQAETSLIEGTGVQLGNDGRWGDYSAMTVDSVDDCTFWYTQEYFIADGGIWQTRIGSFRFPSCGQPKGELAVHVYDALSLEGVPEVMVVAEGMTETLTIQTDAAGNSAIDLLPGTYTLTAGPKLPGYPTPAVVSDVVIAAGSTTNVEIPLDPVPFLEEGAPTVDDYVVYGNNNGYPEPGEQGLLLWNSLTNTGARTATQVMAELVSTTPGVTVTVGIAAYPDIGPGETLDNLTPFAFSIAPDLPCGAVLDFTKVVTTAEGTFTASFSLDAKVPLPVTSVFADDMESGPGAWTTGGVLNQWAITEETAHSPTHAWSDSPGAIYPNNANAWLAGPILDLTDKTGVVLDFWHQYDLENGWDYGHVEYSPNGGGSWLPLASFTGLDSGWIQETLDLSAADGLPNVAFRFRIQSDGSVQADGWYIDDVDLYYEPFACYSPVIDTGVPVPLSPPDGTITETQTLTLTWTVGPGGKPAGYNVDLDGEVFTTTETFLGATLDLGMHAWQVRAFNPLGASAYSPAWSVEITAAPGIPLPLAPPSGTMTTTHWITFTWVAGEGPAPAGYNLELDGEVYTTTQTVWAATLAPGEHTWRVQAFNGWDASGYSPTWDLAILHQVYLPLVLRNH